jgi:hypothetical protein
VIVDAPERTSNAAIKTDDDLSKRTAELMPLEQTPLSNRPTTYSETVNISVAGKLAWIDHAQAEHQLPVRDATEPRITPLVCTGPFGRTPGASAPVGRPIGTRASRGRTL